MVPLVIIQCFTEPESMLFLRRYHICLIWAVFAHFGVTRRRHFEEHKKLCSVQTSVEPKAMVHQGWTCWCTIAFGSIDSCTERSDLCSSKNYQPKITVKLISGPPVAATGPQRIIATNYERPDAQPERPRVDSGGVRVLPHPRQRSTAALLLRVLQPEVLQ